MSAEHLYDKVFRKLLTRRLTVEPSQGSYLQLVSYEDNILVLHPEALRVFEQVKAPIGVVVVGGPSKSGRSSLLNLLIDKPELNSQEGLRSRSPGLWLYNRPAYRGDIEILTIDTEGFDDIEMDSRLMVVLYVISSVFIYNSRGLIDLDSLKRFRVLAQLPALIEMPGRHHASVMQRLAPKFIWVLRDFGVSLVDAKGTPISGQEYLTSVLETADVDHDDYPDSLAATRQILMNLFEQRDCVTFPVPVDHSTANVDMTAQLTPEFMRKLEYLRDTAIENCPSKRFFGQQANGPLLSKMLRRTVEDLNSLSKMDFALNWLQVKETEYAGLLEEVKASYLRRRVIDVEAMPYNENELVINLHNARQKAMESLRKSFVQDSYMESKLMEDLDVFFETDFKFYMEANHQTSVEFNRAILRRVFSEVFQRMDEGYYNNHYRQLEGDWKVAADKFEAKARGPGRFEALIWFADKYQNERFSNFFRSMLGHLRTELSVVKRDCHTIREHRKSIEDEVNRMTTEERTWRELLCAMETKAGIVPSNEPTETKVENLIGWVKDRIALKKRLEEQCRQAEDEAASLFLITKGKTIKKSCFSAL
jgi:hypothetical protein